jgi:hypothetical protein
MTGALVFWGLGPDWWTAIGTLAGAIGTVAAVTVALVQVGIERRARLTRDSEALEQRKRSQAALVSAWVDGERVLQEWESEPGTLVAMLNRSDTAVYNVAVFIVAQLGRSPDSAEAIMRLSKGDNRAYYKLLGVLPPGSWTASSYGSGGMLLQPAVEIAFSDAAGNHWIRRVSGLLEPLSKPAFEYFDVDVVTALTAPTAVRPPE